MRPVPATYLLLACLALPATALAGEIYKYVEKDGTIVYTNVPPKKHGSKARKLKGSFQPAPRATGSSNVAPRQVRVSKEEYDAYVRSAARRYRIPEPLVWAVMHAESAFNPHAVSRVGASGLMQLMPATAEEMYVDDIFDVKQNIEGGTRYLRVLANQFNGDMVKMVAAYNAGPDAVRKYGGNIPPYAETQAYVKKVIKLYFTYKEKHAARLAAEAEKNGTGLDYAEPDEGAAQD